MHFVPEIQSAGERRAPGNFDWTHSSIGLRNKHRERPFDHHGPEKRPPQGEKGPLQERNSRSFVVLGTPKRAVPGRFGVHVMRV